MSGLFEPVIIGPVIAFIAIAAGIVIVFVRSLRCAKDKHVPSSLSGAPEGWGGRE